MGAPAQSILVYDQHCALCRVLAILAADTLSSEWQVLSWPELPPDLTLPLHAQDTQGNLRELCVWTASQWYVGSDAWNVLLAAHPPLAAFQSYAARLGIASPITARWLHRMAHGLRRLCSPCSRPHGRSPQTRQK